MDIDSDEQWTHETRQEAKNASVTSRPKIHRIPFLRYLASLLIKTVKENEKEMKKHQERRSRFLLNSFLL